MCYTVLIDLEFDKTHPFLLNQTTKAFARSVLGIFFLLVSSISFCMPWENQSREKIFFVWQLKLEDGIYLQRNCKFLPLAVVANEGSLQREQFA